MGGKKYPKKNQDGRPGAANPNAASQREPGSNEQQRSNQPRSQNQPSIASLSIASGSQEQRPQSQSSLRQPSQQPLTSASSSGQQSTSKTIAKPNAPALFCKPKGPGKRGTKFKSLLETNYLKLFIDKMVKTVFHYDVKIVPDRPRKYLPKIFEQFCRNNFNVGIAFDGSRNAYAPIELSLANVQQEVNFVHPDTNKLSVYTIDIQPTADMRIPMDALKSYQNDRQYNMPKRALQCLEIILKGAFQQDHLRHGLQTKRSFFLPPTKHEYLQDFFELWLGLFQSTVLGNQPYLNVDVHHKAFPKKYTSLIHLLNEIEQEHRCNTQIALQRMHQHLIGLDLIYVTPGQVDQRRIAKYIELVDIPSRVTFSRDGNTTTIQKYFAERNFPINRPDLPCVKLGNAIRNFSVPMEHCELTDRQVINRKCTDNQTRNMIRKAATSTNERKGRIMHLVDQIRHNQSEIIRGFGISLDTDFTKVPARRLPAPDIVYGNGSVNVIRGVWSGERKTFLLPESANKWAILSASRSQKNELNELADMLVRMSRPTNLNLAERPAYTQEVDSRNIRQIEKEISIAKEEKIRILFCVIPPINDKTYNKIKQLAETRIGVLTQCIKGSTVRNKRHDGSTISNILLKVNAKLNGTNHRLNDATILRDRCMLIGADVTHPSPDQNHIPSVVGVAASHDQNAFCYNVCWRLQGPRIEIINDFKNIVVEHLMFFYGKNKFLPNKILYYRDGVSEGQFEQVMASEKNAIDQGCKEVGDKLKQPGYEERVKLTVIVVQKRHHTRFFPEKTDIGREDRKNNNVPAGTIVDTHIVHPMENHFYLVSHQSIQGVAKPTKYCILFDKGEHSIDDLQALTYNLCHLFSRCNRSVSYPAPTYYAHLVAYRGRIYIETERLNMNQLQREWQTRTIRDEIIHGHPMFFV